MNTILGIWGGGLIALPILAVIVLIVSGWQAYTRKEKGQTFAFALIMAIVSLLFLIYVFIDTTNNK